MGEKYLQVLLSILIPIILILSSITYLSTSTYFHKNEIEKGSVIDQNYVSSTKATEISNEVISYFKGDKQLTESLVGSKAKLHMADVKNLRDLSIYLLYSLIVIFLISSIIILVTNKKERFGKSLIYGSALTLILDVILVTVSQLFFNSFWTKFHGIIFSNDLWQLDPSQNALVAVFSQQFFIDFITLMIIITSLISVILLVLGMYMSSIYSNNQSKKEKTLDLDKSDDFRW